MVPVKNILVTGGAGYLGSVLVRKLVARNFNVTVIDKMLFDTQTLNRFRDDIRIYKEDIRNDKEISKIFKKNKIDCVIHLAALVGDGICNIHPQEAVEINYLATKSLLDIARENKVRKFLFASTCSVYGFSDKLLKETDKVTPVSVYSMTKTQAEEAVLDKSGPNFSTTVFRMATLYGLSLRMRFDLVMNYFTAQAALGEKITLWAGYQWRPFIHVEDAAEAYILALDKSEKLINGQVFNLAGNSQNYQIYQVADLVKKIIPKSEIERDEKKMEPRNYKVDTKKIQRILKFRPHKTIRDGIYEIYQAIHKDRRFVNYRSSKYTNFLKKV